MVNTNRERSGTVEIAWDELHGLSWFGGESGSENGGETAWSVPPLEATTAVDIFGHYSDAI